MSKSAKWEDQCRAEFLFAADHFIHKNKGHGVAETLRQLSKDSGIPYGTLRRWFYARENSFPKDGKTEVGAEPQKQEDSPQPPMLCGVCRIRLFRQQTSKDEKNRSLTRCWQDGRGGAAYGSAAFTGRFIKCLGFESSPRSQRKNEHLGEIQALSRCRFLNIPNNTPINIHAIQENRIEMV